MIRRVCPGSDVGLATVADGQTVAALTTIDALRQYPGFYHLQNVVVRGEFAIEGTRMFLRADEREFVQLDEGQRTEGYGRCPGPVHGCGPSGSGRCTSGHRC